MRRPARFLLLILTVVGLLVAAHSRHLTLLLVVAAGLAAALLALLIRLPDFSRIARWPLARQLLRRPRIAHLAHRLYSALQLSAGCLRTSKRRSETVRP